MGVLQLSHKAKRQIKKQIVSKQVSCSHAHARTRTLGRTCAAKAALRPRSALNFICEIHRCKCQRLFETDALHIHIDTQGFLFQTDADTQGFQSLSSIHCIEYPHGVIRRMLTTLNCLQVEDARGEGKTPSANAVLRAQVCLYVRVCV